MSILDGILAQVAGNQSVVALAGKVGLSPEQAEMALAALAHAHKQPGDTVAEASDQTGLPHDKLSQIVGHLGGEDALGSIASQLQQQGSGGIGSLSKLL